jgi:RNA polymerase sigma factor (sigma-70 family)
VSSETLEQLFARYLAFGDDSALELLFRRAAVRLRAFGLRLGLPADRLEELVHETLVAAVQRSHTFTAGTALLPWLCGILARKAASHHRDELRRLRHHAARDDRDHDPNEPIDAAAAAELRELLQQTIGELPPRYREVVALHLQQGLPPAEIAQRLGRLTVTVRVHLHRGLQILRRLLPRGLGPALLAAWCALRAAEAPPERPPIAPRRPFALGTAAAAAALLVAAVVWLQPGSADAAPATRTADAGIGAPSTPATEADRAAAAPVQRTEPPDRAHAGPTLTVVVHDAAGRPLPDVGVTVEPAAVVDPLPQRRRVRTDAEGRAAVPNRGDVPLRVRSDRGHDQRVHAAATQLVLVAAGTTVQVTVTDERGRGAPDVPVWLAADAASAACGGIVGSTDANGRLTLAAVRRGALVAACGAGRGATPVEFDGRTAALHLALQPAFAVFGRVLDPDGAPIADARVVGGDAADDIELGLPDGLVTCRWPAQAVRSDARGEFGPLWLPAGEHTLHARAVGRAPGHTPLALGERSAPPATLVLEQARTLVGRVVTDDGVPVTAAQLVFRSADRDHRIDTRSGDDGAFALDLPHRDGALCARSPDHLPLRVAVPAGAVPSPCELRLPRLPVYTLQLTFDDGRPAAHWSLRCRTRVQSALDEDTHVESTDAAGTCTLRVPEPAFAAAVFQARASGDPVWHELDAPVRRGEQWAFVLAQELAPSAALRGRCVDRHGTPLPGARVYLRRAGGIAWEAGATDGDGAFEQPRLAPGRYAVFAESCTPTLPSAWSAEFDLPGGTRTDVVVRGGSSGTLAYALTAAGRIPAAAYVTVVGGTPPRRYAASPHAAGEQALPVGDYLLYAMGEDFVWLDGLPFRVEAGGRTVLDLALEPAVRTPIALRGAVPPCDGALRVQITRTGDGRPFGSFQLLPDALPAVTAFLPRGDYELRVDDAAGASASCGALRIDALPPAPRAHEVWLAPTR